MRTRRPIRRNPQPERSLLLDESRGVYIPIKFVTNFQMMVRDSGGWEGVTLEDIDELEKGPDSDIYWDVWDDVLNNASITINGVDWYLEQDGDLFAVRKN